MILCYSAMQLCLTHEFRAAASDKNDTLILQDAVRGDHGEVATLLINHGGKVMGSDGELIELADSPLAGNVRMFTGYDPEWEIDVNALTVLEKIGGHLLSHFKSRISSMDRALLSLIDAG